MTWFTVVSVIFDYTGESTPEVLVDHVQAHVAQEAQAAILNQRAEQDINVLCVFEGKLEDLLA